MIRVTQNRQNALALQSVMTARARMQQAQETAMTGVRVAKPSDDPAAAARARLLGELESRAESHRTVISYGTARMQTAEQALAEAGTVLTRAREIATAMANDTMSSAERAAAATEVEQLRQTMGQLINTRHGDEYVFANVATHSPPYVDGTGFAYDVDGFSDVRRAEVGPSEIAEIGASGSTAFAQRAADPNSVDVVAALAGLAANLASNDAAGVRVDIDTISRSFDQVLVERTRVGVRMDQLRRADEAADQSSTVYATLRSDLVDADAAEAFSRLSLTQTSMQAAVTVASRMLGPSLLDV